MVRKKTILVTGGAGYIGSHACKALHLAGYMPVTFDNLSQGSIDFVKWGPFFQGDLQNLSDIEAVFKKYQPEAVIHFAASALVIESLKNPSKYYRNNLFSTVNLLDTSLKFGVKKIVFSSTCATYGMPRETPILEETVQDPINPYGKSKLMIEKILSDYEDAYGLQFAALRYFNAAGNDLDGEIGECHDPETHLIPLLVQTALKERESFTIYGDNFPTKDGYAIRDFVHVNDLVRAHLLSLDYLFTHKESLKLNLGSGSGYSVMEVLNLLEAILGTKLNVKVAPKREGEPAILIADTSKAKKLLSWEAKLDLQTILKSAIDWQRNLALS